MLEEMKIAGGYVPYIYAGLLSLSLFFLQRPAYEMRRSGRFPGSAGVLLFFEGSAAIATVMVWLTRLLVAYVIYAFGWKIGLALLFAGPLLSTVAVNFVPIFPFGSYIYCVLAWPATAAFAYLLVRALNVL